MPDSPEIYATNVTAYRKLIKRASKAGDAEATRLYMLALAEYQAKNPQPRGPGVAGSPEVG